VPGILTLLLVVPLAGAGAAMLVGPAREREAQLIGLGASGTTFALAAWVWATFPGGPGLAYEEHRVWVPGLGIGYHVGVDGLSVSLVALVAFLFPLALGASGGQVRQRVRSFVATALLLEAALLGTFLAQDMVLFYVFWEAMLIPMYFLIALWGGPARGAAAIKFFLYTMAGSVLMLLGMIAVYARSGAAGPATFDLPALLARPVGFPPGLEALLFASFAVAFAIKMPVWPLHTWLPDAYAEAPAVVTVLLASLMSKAGAYGFLRFCLPLFPHAARTYGPLLVGLAVVGILYGGAVAWAQRDLRRLLAYGSMSHMGLILLGLFALNLTGIQGSLIEMVNHGISTGALFLLAGALVERTGQARTDAYGGLGALTPALGAVTLIAVMSSLALPGTNGFIGEFLILLGAFQSHRVAAALATGGIVVAVAYLLAFVGRVFHGPPRPELRGIRDLGPREYLVLVPLILVVFWVGFAPQPFLARSESAVERVLHRVAAAGGVARVLPPGPEGGPR
jgi:NADH-quinone oxidoreductase subunit M